MCFIGQLVRQLSARTVDRDRVSCALGMFQLASLLLWLCSRFKSFPPSISLSPTLPPSLQRYLQQMEYLFEVAMTDDERGKWKEAESLYNSAIEFALEAVSIIVCHVWLWCVQ